MSTIGGPAGDLDIGDAVIALADRELHRRFDLLRSFVGRPRAPGRMDPMLVVPLLEPA